MRCKSKNSMEAVELKRVLEDEGLSLEDKKRVLDENKVQYREEDGKIFIDEPEQKRNLLSCMDDIVKKTTVKSKEDEDEKVFNENVFSDAKESIAFVSESLDITAMQAVLFSMLMEHNCRRGKDLVEFAGDLGMTRMTLYSYESDLSALENKKLVRRDEKENEIKIPQHVVNALVKHGRLDDKDRKNLDTDQIMEMINSIYDRVTDDDLSEGDFVCEIDDLLKANPQNHFVNEVKSLGLTDHDSKLILYTLIYRYQFENDDNVGWHDFEDVVDLKYRTHILERNFRAKTLKIAADEIAVPKVIDGMASPTQFHLADSVKERLFAEIGGCRETNGGVPLKTVRIEDIVSKELFYNSSERDQVQRLTDLLSDEKYMQTCERLKSKGLRTGFSCLFYGGPGTGKTETVYQIARQTGRELVPINVQEIKSCWVGESEKQVKSVFDRYRAMVEKAKTAPILLFNEADAIFGVRKDGATNAVDKMENSIQNIILQEMEKLDGILIATTNLTGNLDKAFERRFLYKIEFKKPEPEVKSKIWLSMIPELTEEQSRELSRCYDFSGGQIENITRKREISYILYGEQPGFEEIKAYCGEEMIASPASTRKSIGF